VDILDPHLAQDLGGRAAMSEAIGIREFRAEDQATVRALVLAGLGDHFGVIDQTKNPDLDDIVGTYVGHGHLVVVAESDGEIVGAGTLVEETFQIGRLVRMSVARARRGQGIGRKLVEYLLEAARARGYEWVLVETTDDWHDAIGLYRACGFEIEGYRDGDVHLVKELASA
jgi:ribosomal protein S18 acetylase RimI-like enzyme